VPSVFLGPALVRRALAGAAAVLAFAGVCLAAEPSVGVAVVHTAASSPGDGARDGAGEFEVLIRVAQLRHAHAAAGLISVGDHNGSLQCGGERALRWAALAGVSVVKLAPGGEVAADPDQLFVDAGHLTEEQAHLVLRQCLERYGPPPAAADPARPTKNELAAIHSHLRRFQTAFAMEGVAIVAAK